MRGTMTPKLFVVTEKAEDSAHWLSPLRGSFDVVVSASVAGSWQFLQGDQVCGVVVQLLSPAKHAPRLVSALLGRNELRGVPVYVLMPGDQLAHPTLSGVNHVHLIDEARAHLDLPVLLLRTAREASGTHASLGRVRTDRLDQVLRRALPAGGPKGGLRKTSGRDGADAPLRSGGRSSN